MNTNKIFKILLSNNQCQEIEEKILNAIPFFNNIIQDKNSKNSLTIDLQEINDCVFSYIIALLKYKLSEKENSQVGDNSTSHFESNLIHNMNLDALMDFILITNNFGLKEYCTLASDKFRKLVINESLQDLRHSFNIYDDFNEAERKEILIDSEWRDETE